MTVSKNSTRNRGHELIERLDRVNRVLCNRLEGNYFEYTRGDVEALQREVRNALYRLRFLEMCVLGLTEAQLTEANEQGKKAVEESERTAYWQEAVDKL